MHIIILRTCVCERACVKMREQAPGKRTEGSGSKAEPSGASRGRKQGRAERSEPRAEECGRGRKETEILEVTQGSCF